MPTQLRPLRKLRRYPRAPRLELVVMHLREQSALDIVDISVKRALDGLVDGGVRQQSTGFPTMLRKVKL